MPKPESSRMGPERGQEAASEGTSWGNSCSQRLGGEICPLALHRSVSRALCSCVQPDSALPQLSLGAGIWVLPSSVSASTSGYVALALPHAQWGP